ncbi:Uncharacterised protein [uncultured archaeon]|nr:Uncharacterised protein [uncultured archaeon]
MDFNYVEAQKRVSDELNVLADELWEKVEQVYSDETHFRPSANHIEAVKMALYLLGTNESVQEQGVEIDSNTRKKFSMLYELSTNGYWNAVKAWSQIEPSLNDDAEFYAKLMIEQAKRESRQRKSDYVWIVEQYDNGILKNFINDELLNESVNAGFWELAGNYLTCEMMAIPRNQYDTIMKYPEHLDLSRVNEFRTKPLLANGNYGEWIDKRYVDAFKKARKKGALGLESEAFLARPIIELAFDIAFGIEAEDSEAFLKDALKPYGKYLETKIIRSLLKDEIKKRVIAVSEGSDWDQEVCLLEHAEILAEYLRLPKKRVRMFISSILLNEEELRVSGFIKDNFPKDWITPKARSRIKDAAEIYYDGLARLYASQEIIPALGILQKAMKKDFFDVEKGKKIIAKGLEEYLETKRHTASSEVKNLIGTLKPEFVPDDLYKAVRAKVDKDLSKSEALSKINRIRAPKWKRELDKRTS